MTISKASTSTEGRDLILTRMIDAPPEKVFKAWTDPELLRQWFVPAPWTIAKAETDVRPGRRSAVVMRSPEGANSPTMASSGRGEERAHRIYGRYREAWEPSEKPFMTVIVTFEEVDGKTKYTARARHWTVADGEAHEAMGFHAGWAACAEQLAALVARV